VQGNSIEYAELSLTDTQSLMHHSPNTAVALTPAAGQSHADRRGDLSPIVYSQIVHHVPPRSFASDYSLAGSIPLEPPGGGGANQTSSSATMTTTVTSYSAEAEINHPGSSLSLDVAPSEYLERSLVSSFR